MKFERNTAPVLSRAEVLAVVMASFETACLLRLSAQKFHDLLKVDLFCKIQGNAQLFEFAEGMREALTQVILREKCEFHYRSRYGVLYDTTTVLRIRPAERAGMTCAFVWKDTDFEFTPWQPSIEAAL